MWFSRRLWDELATSLNGGTHYAIVAAVREGRQSVTEAATFDDGYRVQLVLDAARASNESGCWLKLQ